MNIRILITCGNISNRLMRQDNNWIKKRGKREGKTSSVAFFMNCNGIKICQKEYDNLPCVLQEKPFAHFTCLKR